MICTTIKLQSSNNLFNVFFYSVLNPVFVDINSSFILHNLFLLYFFFLINSKNLFVIFQCLFVKFFIKLL